MKAGKNLIPASRMATTKGLAAAFAALQGNHLSMLNPLASRVGSPLVGTSQCGRVGWDEQTNNEDSTDIEHKDSPESALDSPRDGLSGVPGFSD